MAKVVRFRNVGGPEVLQIEELALGAPKPGDVRIKVGAIGLNRVETMFRKGEMGIPSLPSRIGYEAAGIVDAVGKDVTTVQIGARVATLPGLSMEEYGTYGDTIFYPANMLLPVPDNLSMNEAAAAWMQYLTAYALIGMGHIQKNDAVVITAASSSVGLAAIQIVNAAGATGIAITRGKDKIKALRDHGAQHVVMTQGQNVVDTVDAVMSITEGRGARIVFDAVAGDGFAQLTEMAAQRGTIIIYGALSGDIAPLPVHQTMLKSLTVRGFAMNDFMSDDATRQAAIPYICKGLETKQLRPIIDRVFNLEAIAVAHRYLESNQQVGKVVVQVSAANNA